MRPETKIGAGVTIVAIAAAIAFFMWGGEPAGKPAPPAKNETKQPASAENAKSPEAAKVSDAGKPGSSADSGSLASPPPVSVNTDAERSFRPRPIEPSATEQGPIAERTGLALPETKKETAPPVSPAELVTKAPEPAPAPATPVTPAAVPAETASKEKVAIAPPPRVPDGTKEHVIQSGETYSSLATKYFGSEKYASLIAKANPGKDARRLHVGAKIIIPPAPVAAAASPTATQPATPTATTVKNVRVPAEETAAPIPAGRAYKVQAGESWNDLAQRFLGDSNRWTELYELNRERVPHNPNALKAGMTIELPEKLAATSKPS